MHGDNNVKFQRDFVINNCQKYLTLVTYQGSGKDSQIYTEIVDLVE
jgi:hypothetical protein